MEAHSAASVTSLIYPTINLVALVSFLVWKLKAPVSEFVKKRHVYVRDEVQRVSEQLQKSQVKYQEYSSKLKAIDAEVNAIRDQSLAEAKEVQTRVINEANRLTKQILDDARIGAQTAFLDSKSSIRAEFVRQVMERAEKTLTAGMNDGQQAQTRQNFIQQVGASS
jgi:F0F1-type ATP synthase membrane subunit b/b'